jgi:hypothetical protein
MGFFGWGVRYDVKRIFGNCDVEFRVGERCINQHCERDYSTKDRLFWPPSSVVPPDEIDIVVQDSGGKCHQSSARSSNESQRRGPLFVWLVIPHPVELELLTTSLLMQWNVELEEAFIITTPDSARLDTMSTPVSTCVCICY